MTDTINNVPRKLLERASNLAFQTQHYPLHEELRTLLSAPSPAGVDGLSVVAVVSSDDGTTAGYGYLVQAAPDGEELCRLSDAQAIIDGLQEKIERLQFSLEVAKTDELSAAVYAETESIKHSLWNAEKECDQHAKRIGEMEGLLLRVQVSLSLDDTEWGYSGAEKYKLLADIRAALSAGKVGE